MKYLQIIDDIFPQYLSAFRIAEFEFYLNNYKKTKIYSDGFALSVVNESRGIEKVISDYINQEKAYKKKVKVFNPGKIRNNQLIYSVFINNIFRYIDLVNKTKNNFVFTLYPGGGFAINNEESDFKLKKVIESKYFKSIITTQDLTHNYIRDKFKLTDDNVYHIYGGVLPTYLVNTEHVNQNIFKKNDVINICFVAYKYTEKGLDKGFDVFCEVYNSLYKNNSFQFHLVGPWQNDLSLLKSDKSLTFYGCLNTAQLYNFYYNMDIILSPNRKNILCPGAFDGFPTGACVQASLCGVALFVTDPYDNNNGRYLSKEIQVINTQVETLIDLLNFYQKNRDKLSDLKIAGCKKSVHLFDFKNQMDLRFTYLKKYL